MKPNSVRILLHFLTFIFITLSHSTPTQLPSFIHCLSTTLPFSTLSHLLHTPNTSSYSSILNSSIKNLLFSTSPKPLLILTPSLPSHLQPIIICSKSLNIPLRFLSGGHDYEGLSYRSLNSHHQPFILLSLSNLHNITIDVNAKQATAWVQSGTIIGELYYKIAKVSSNFNSNNLNLSYGFPAGICPTVAVGGHFSGGGFGTLLRKYGLAVDNVVDAQIVDVNGEMLDRESMGEDLFWAIRGGGGASFGVVVSWKVKLVLVPHLVTVFSIHKTFDQGAVELIYQWQDIAHRLHEDLFIRVIIQRNDLGQVEALFNSMFLGNCEQLLLIMNESFPNLGIKPSDCKQMSWIESVMYFAGYTNGEPLETLLVRQSQPERYFKATSDFVTRPIPKSVWTWIWDRVKDEGAGVLILDPFGGKMNQIEGSEIPFPHREGNLYNIQYFVEWRKIGEAEKHVNWVKGVFEGMGPYVSKDPRAGYINYRDLDLGVNEEEEGISSYFKGRVWGVKYFKGNFERLARVKGRVDPSDFFRSEQSIPPLFLESEEVDGDVIKSF
ncbi:berberine bridge enzyme-like 22 [Dioscorea cayenensis subsp. rotundata]|uniref:Berberine bridge enzyme-like 22 n=1 Tax=Dioscorea cayennensis subsp. rotundata TaxID=55577 RepID=A0AB40CRV4_DIOCR|nr:berberine bridge enzyme-like 22 [Dioscorea cayenensis subsp. rotundata]